MVQEKSGLWGTRRGFLKRTGAILAASALPGLPRLCAGAASSSEFPFELVPRKSAASAGSTATVDPPKCIFQKRSGPVAGLSTMTTTAGWIFIWSTAASVISSTPILRLRFITTIAMAPLLTGPKKLAFPHAGAGMTLGAVPYIGLQADLFKFSIPRFRNRKFATVSLAKNKSIRPSLFTSHAARPQALPNNLAMPDSRLTSVKVPSPLLWNNQLGMGS